MTCLSTSLVLLLLIRRGVYFIFIYVLKTILCNLLLAGDVGLLFCVDDCRNCVEGEVRGLFLMDDCRSCVDGVGVLDCCFW